MTKNHRNREEGASAVFVAVVVLVLMALVSLAVDGGLAWNTRRSSQNAADLSALAAAWQNCNPDPTAGTPEQVGLSVAAQNGFTHTPGGTPQVSITGGGPLWTATISQVNDSTFGGATPYAPDELTVASEATAQCLDVGILGGFAIFGETASCNGDNVDLTGDDITVVGGIHSNDDLKILPSGSGGSFTGEITYRDDANLKAGISGSKYFGSPIPYPIDIETSEYAPSGARTAAAAAASEYFPFTADIGNADLGTVSGNDLIVSQPGIYYTTGDIKLNNKTLVLTGDAADRGITLVAEGEIDLGSAEDLKGYDPIAGPNGPRMLLFADGDGSVACNAKDIKISGSDVEWSGVMFAPNGAIEASASGFSTLYGSIIGYQVNLSGSSLTVQFQDDPDADPNYRVELVS